MNNHPKGNKLRSSLPPTFPTSITPKQESIHQATERTAPPEWIPIITTNQPYRQRRQDDDDDDKKRRPDHAISQSTSHGSSQSTAVAKNY